MKNLFILMLTLFIETIVHAQAAAHPPQTQVKRQTASSAKVKQQNEQRQNLIKQARLQAEQAVEQMKYIETHAMSHTDFTKRVAEINVRYQQAMQQINSVQQPQMAPQRRIEY
jgi:hypothetical protein